MQRQFPRFIDGLEYLTGQAIGSGGKGSDRSHGNELFSGLYHKIKLTEYAVRQRCCQSVRSGRERRRLAAVSSGKDSAMGSHFTRLPSSIAIAPR